MKGSMKAAIVAVVLAAVWAQRVVGVPVKAEKGGVVVVEEEVWETLRSPLAETTLIVYLETEADLSGVEAEAAASPSARLSPDRAGTERARVTRERLVQHAEKTQGATVQLLRMMQEGGRVGSPGEAGPKAALRVEPLWIVNALLVFHADRRVLQALVAQHTRLGIRLITADRELPLVGDAGADADADMDATTTTTTTTTTDSNIAHIGAPAAWQGNQTGQGIRIGSLDTGVRGTHEALRETFVGLPYGWFDPRGVHASPVDNTGQGTHTLGIAAGSMGSGVGVAPGAQWLAAMGCATSSCASSDLMRGAQYMVCPDAPGCTLRPHIVVNSWGGGRGDAWFSETLAAWRAAGMVGVFAAGSGGPQCATTGSPADNAGALAVGAVSLADTLASFSARGPSPLDTAHPVRPHIAAPGISVRSALHTADAAYALRSGSAAAAAHVAGAAALVWGANPAWTPDRVEAALFAAALSRGLPPPDGSVSHCGGLSYDVFPNNFYGYGSLRVAL